MAKRQEDLEEGAVHICVSPLHFFARVGTICFYRLRERSSDLGRKSFLSKVSNMLGGDQCFVFSPLNVE